MPSSTPALRATPPASRWPTRRLVVELVITAMGLALLLWAVLAPLGWMQRHTVADAIHSPSLLEAGQRAKRGIGIIGALLVLLVRPRLGRWAARVSAKDLIGTSLACFGAAALSLFMCEVALRRHPVPFLDLPEFKMTERDPELGWNYRPRLSVSITHRRRIDYVFDEHGNRVAAADQGPDPGRPSLIFTGESIAAGWDLPYKESFPFLVGQSLGLQEVNVAVQGYATWQAYAKVRRELPRFAHPIAVVTVMATLMLDRNINPSRTHAVLRGDGSVERAEPWNPFWSDLRLGQLLRRLVPIHVTDPIPVGIATVRETVRLAEQRGAFPLFVFLRHIASTAPGVPHPDDWVVKSLLADEHVPYVTVDLQPSWMIKDDGNHPTLEGTQTIAKRVVERLTPEIAAKPRQGN